MVNKRSSIYASLLALGLSLLSHAGILVSLFPESEKIISGSFSISIRDEKVRFLKGKVKDVPRVSKDQIKQNKENNIVTQELGNNDIRIVYPKRSRQLEEEGIVVLTFYINKWGKAENINIVQSSGHDRLDREAQRAVAEAVFSLKEVDKELTIDFKLKDIP
ncbi:MAG: hypothetical protein OHK0056_08820 [Bacteriovoracaceae bacterium]